MAMPAAFRPSPPPTVSRQARRFAAFVRDTRVLLHEFRWTLLFAALALGGGATLLRVFWDGAGPRPDWFEALYFTAQLCALQTSIPLPHAWTLRAVFVALPVFSFVILAESLVRFGILFFNRKNRMEAWNVSLAATEKNHVIVCGLGRIGYRIAEEFERMGQRCVAIEAKKEGTFIDTIRAKGIAVLTGDARRRAQLEEAGCARAKAVICATNDDLANVEIALTARQIAPGIRVVVRMFDPRLAEKFGAAFDMETFSTTAISAPVFAAAALDRRILHSFHLGERALSVAQVVVGRDSELKGRLVRELEERFDASIVALVRGKEVDLHPAPDVIVAEHDELAVLASLDILAQIESANGKDVTPLRREG